MTHVFTLRRAAVVSGLLIGALGLACGSPTSPTPRTTATPPAASPPSPPPAPPTFTRYRIAGVVTGDNGAPLADASINVDYPPGGQFANPPSRCVRDWFCIITTRANSRGEFDVEFEPGPGTVFNAQAAALIYSLRDGFEAGLQLVPRGAAEQRQTLRLRQVRTVSAGQAISASIEHDSSLCSDLEDWWVLTNRCEVLTVVASEADAVPATLAGARAGDLVVLFCCDPERSWGLVCAHR